MPVTDFAPEGLSQLRPLPGIPAENMPMIIPIKFFTKYKTPEGSSVTVEEDWCQWVKKGDGGGAMTGDAIKRIKNSLNWTVIGPAYDAWKQGNKAPTSGTPLYAWNGVTREMADELKKFSIFSIEDLAQFPDHNLSKLPIQHLRDWRKKAQAWVEAAGTSDIGAKLAERDKKIELQADQLVDMAEQFKEMKAAMEALKRQSATVANAAAGLQHIDDEDMPVANPGETLVAAEAPAKRSPGRPRKAD